jgi:RyR domain
MRLPDIEAVAAKVHDEWMRNKHAAGITSRKSETGEELMVPYDQLSEAAKELQRGSVKAVYRALGELAGGFLQVAVNSLKAVLGKK